MRNEQEVRAQLSEIELGLINLARVLRQATQLRYIENLRKQRRNLITQRMTLLWVLEQNEQISYQLLNKEITYETQE